MFASECDVYGLYKERWPHSHNNKPETGSLILRKFRRKSGFLKGRIYVRDNAL